MMRSEKKKPQNKFLSTGCKHWAKQTMRTILSVCMRETITELTSAPIFLYVMWDPAAAWFNEPRQVCAGIRTCEPQATKAECADLTTTPPGQPPPPFTVFNVAIRKCKVMFVACMLSLLDSAGPESVPLQSLCCVSPRGGHQGGETRTVTSLL